MTRLTLGNLLCVLLFLFGIFPAAISQSGADYDALVQQGKAQLQAGNNDAALASANAAIKLDANRWEAYALAGGALMNLKRCEEAADRFSDAIKHAPEVKQSGLRELRKQCLASESASTLPPAKSPASGESQSAPAQSSPRLQDILAWIASNLPPQIYEGIVQEITYQGCKVQYQWRDTRGSGDSTTFLIELNKLPSDSVSIKENPPQLFIHSVRGMTQHDHGEILSVHAIENHETKPDENVDAVKDVVDFGYALPNVDMANRTAHAWRDAISKCTNNVPSNLY